MRRTPAFGLRAALACVGVCAIGSGCSASATNCAPCQAASNPAAVTASSGAGRPLSVCSFEHPGTPSEPDAQGLVRIPVSHPNLAYLGRVDCARDGAVGFAHAGGIVRFAFKGSALDFLYRDHGGNGETDTNYFAVVVDQRAPQVIAMNSKQEVYPIARDLPPGEHQVEIFKRTESGQLGKPGIGRGEFLGLRVPQGSEILPARPHAHRIEFIGDSITCGFGTEATTSEPDKVHYSSRNSSAFSAWAAITARTLDADLMLVCYSGRGAYRNYSGLAGDPLPVLYPRIDPDDSKSKPWDFSKFTPEVVVINLGTNDFSPGGVDRAKFRDAYAKFLATLRTTYPDATFILAVGPMMSDFYPPNEKAWSSIQEDLNTLLQQRRAAGDSNVHPLILPTQTGPFGEDWHPTVMQQASMANQAVQLIRAVRGF
ncbi:MAG TPA: SGNH/GDSL hydrolase family protein [Polyangiaceae bacterium]|nr:SGNH/GDSL hydrolase family protein [Polyangiaceae bacterium]